MSSIENFESFCCTALAEKGYNNSEHIALFECKKGILSKPNSFINVAYGSLKLPYMGKKLLDKDCSLLSRLQILKYLSENMLLTNTTVIEIETYGVLSTIVSLCVEYSQASKEEKNSKSKKPEIDQIEANEGNICSTAPYLDLSFPGNCCCDNSDNSSDLFKLLLVRVISKIAKTTSGRMILCKKYSILLEVLGSAFYLAASCPEIRLSAAEVFNAFSQEKKGSKLLLASGFLIDLYEYLSPSSCVQLKETDVRVRYELARCLLNILNFEGNTALEIVSLHWSRLPTILPSESEILKLAEKAQKNINNKIYPAIFCRSKDEIQSQKTIEMYVCNLQLALIASRKKEVKESLVSHNVIENTLLPIVSSLQLFESNPLKNVAPYENFGKIYIFTWALLASLSLQIKAKALIGSSRIFQTSLLKCFTSLQASSNENKAFDESMGSFILQTALHCLEAKSIKHWMLKKNIADMTENITKHTDDKFIQKSLKILKAQLLCDL